MRVLIVEDELPIAEDIREICQNILGPKLSSIKIELTLGNALLYLTEKQVDVLLLDLNLSGKNGFDILKEVVSYSFHTIIISANIDRAIEAYEYGVVDFIPKPYNEERIKKAFDRLENLSDAHNQNLKYISVRKLGSINLIPINEVKYIKGANVYTELHLRKNEMELYDKTLDTLSKILPQNFFRVHKSYIVDLNDIEKINIYGGGKYEIELHSREIIPVSRDKFSELKNKFDSIKQ